MAAHAELDHVVIHVDDWGACRRFYRDILGFEEIENPEGSGNPLGAWAFRAAGLQINVHGPWPGQTGNCCPPPFNEIGRSDLAFRTVRSPARTIEWLGTCGVTIVEGPIRRFGARGWGTSVYCHDPSGNGVELITYRDS